MKPTTNARSISAALLGVIGGIAFYFRELRQFGVSREAFLAAQSIRYDRVVGNHHRLISGIVACIVIAAMIVGLYELILLVVTRILAWLDERRGASGS